MTPRELAKAVYRTARHNGLSVAQIKEAMSSNPDALVKAYFKAQERCVKDCCDRIRKEGA